MMTADSVVSDFRGVTLLRPPRLKSVTEKVRTCNALRSSDYSLPLSYTIN